MNHRVCKTFFGGGFDLAGILGFFDLAYGYVLAGLEAEAHIILKDYANHLAVRLYFHRTDILAVYGNHPF